MLLEVASGQQYTAHFIHRKDKREHWETTCVFHEGKCQVPLKECVDLVDVVLSRIANSQKNVGFSHCNPIDQFNKAKGRIIALERALNNYTPVSGTASFQRAKRKEIWTAYFKICPKK